MSTFKYHRNNNHRYNIYESHIETVEVKDSSQTIRNILFFIALTVSLLLTIFVFFKAYEKQENRNKITKLEITQEISKGIIQKFDADNSFKNIDNKQLKRIIKNVITKVKSSPNHTFLYKK